MEKKQIGIRELHRNLPTITNAVARGGSFVVIKHAKPIFSINPIEKIPQKTYTLADLKSITFSHKNKKMSKNIDAMVYGV